MKPHTLRNTATRLRAAALTVFALLCAVAPALAAHRKPNFILVLCDDLGYGDIRPYGGSIPTPAIDRLAKQGLVATSYYCPANICTPSRAGILTGRYPVRTGLGYEVILFDDDRMLPHSEKTIASVLKPDYATGLFGKWHLGHKGDWLPTNYGFDVFYGLPYSHDILPLPLYDADANTGKATSIDVSGSTELQQMFFARAEKFLDANKDHPFFLELALSTPHLPSHPRKDFLGRSDAGPYGDTVLEIDSIVGRLLDKLKALQLDQNTVIVFTSDNGAWFEGSNSPLRDRKGGPGYDGGYRVPFIVWAPGIVKPGKTDAIVCGVDLLPTFASLAGMPLPKGVDFDGRDISAVWTKGAESPHEAILLFNNEDVVGIRTPKWKFVELTYYRGLNIPLRTAGYPQLYDAARDTTESYSLAGRHPEIAADLANRIKEANAKFAPFKKGIPEAIKRQKAKMADKQQD